MKVKFKGSIRGMRGINRKEDLVYCNYNKGQLNVVRTLPKREATEQNVAFGKITTNLHNLYITISPEYKRNMSIYAIFLSQLPGVFRKPSGYALFIRMMWALRNRYPEIDLETITREDILNNEYPIRSVVEAMQSGVLTHIAEAEMLVSTM
jgi:hypothetical protein